MPTEDGNQELANIVQAFYMNLAALRVFNENIGQLAEEYDQTTQNKILAVTAKAQESMTKKANAPGKENLELLLEITQTLQTALIPQRGLLRQSALPSLISYFEALEAGLLQFFYLAYPNAIPSEGKLLSLAELRELGSIEEAERALITREVETILRDTTEAQLEYFTKQTHIDLKCLNPYRDTLLEVVQRRNLFIHNRGIVNKIYLRKVNQDYIKKNKIEEGQHLTIDNAYLSMAIDTICICGIMLIQQSWRKWDEKNTESMQLANITISSYILGLLFEKRWDLADKLAGYVTGLPLMSDEEVRSTIINQAIALKEQSKLGEMESLLSKKDWSACALKFRIALYALRDQYDQMTPLLPKAIAAEEFSQREIETWPLFRWFRESSHYQSMLIDPLS